MAGNFVNMRGNRIAGPGERGRRECVESSRGSTKRAHCCRVGPPHGQSTARLPVPDAADPTASHEGFFAREFVLRLANIPLLLVVIAATWGLLGLAFPCRKSLQVLGSAAVAVQPQLIHISAVVNSDLFLAAVWATALFLGVLLVERPPTRWRVAAMVLLGIAWTVHTRARACARSRDFDRPPPDLGPLARGNLDPAPRRLGSRGDGRSGLGRLCAALRVRVLVGGCRRQAGRVLPLAVLSPRVTLHGAHITEGWGIKNIVVDRFFSGFANYEVSFTPRVLRALGWAATAIAAGATIGLAVQREAVARHARAAIFVVLSGVVGARGCTPLPCARSPSEGQTHCSPADTWCRSSAFTDWVSPLPSHGCLVGSARPSAGHCSLGWRPSRSGRSVSSWSASMGRSAAVLAGGVAVLAAFWIFAGGPFLSEPTSGIASVPQPPPLSGIALVPVRSDGRACLDQATVTREGRSVQVRVGTYGRPAGRLEVSLSAPGYRSTTSLPAGWFRDNDLVNVPISPPRIDVLATICLRNLARDPIALYGGTRSGSSRSYTTVDGRVVRENISLTVLATGQPRLVDARDSIMRRALLFDPAIVAAWWLWPLGILVFIVGPVVLVFLLAAAVRQDSRLSGR